MIPVMHRGVVVGYLPTVRLARGMLFFSVPFVPPVDLTKVTARHPYYEKPSCVELRVVDQWASGEPGELHVDVDGLKNLNLVPGFVPEDEFLRRYR